jgi:hypothetical protein
MCIFSASVITLILRRARRGRVTCEAATEDGLWLVGFKTLGKWYLLSVSEHGTADIMSRLVQVLSAKKSCRFRCRDNVDTIHVTCEDVYREKNLKLGSENSNTFYKSVALSSFYMAQKTRIKTREPAENLRILFDSNAWVGEVHGNIKYLWQFGNL